MAEASEVLRELAAARRLLLLRLRSLGDSILSLPLLEALRSWNPELELDVLVESPYSPVFEGHPAVRDVVVMDPSRARGPGKWEIAREIRRRRYPAALNLHGGTTSLLLTLATGARLRIGQEAHRHAWAYNVRLPSSSSIWGRSNLHTVEHQLSLLRWLGVRVAAPERATLPVTADARARIADRLASAGFGQDAYVVVHPTATLFTKQWPEENFAHLGDLLRRETRMPVIFTSGGRESAILARVKEAAREKHRYWSDLGLSDLFALIEGARLFVGNDSGPTHAAAALGRPLVVVWGSSNFAAWHPWGTDFEAVRSDLPCMPCPGYTCEAFGTPKCILDITVPRVLDACRRLLARTRS